MFRFAKIACVVACMAFMPFMACMLCMGLPGVAAAAGLGTAAFDPLASISEALGSPAAITATVEPVDDGTSILVVTATLEEGWHLYSLEQKPGGPQATRIVAGTGWWSKNTRAR